MIRILEINNKSLLSCRFYSGTQQGSFLWLKNERNFRLTYKITRTSNETHKAFKGPSSFTRNHKECL